MGICLVIQIKIPNAIAGAPPILLKRWVKVKHVPTE